MAQLPRCPPRAHCAAILLILCFLSVVEAEHIVVHVEVLRAGRRRQQKENLSEFQRVGLRLHLITAQRDTPNAHSSQRAALAPSRCSCALVIASIFRFVRMRLRA